MNFYWLGRKAVGCTGVDGDRVDDKILLVDF